jgi:hypothetical protein
VLGPVGVLGLTAEDMMANSSAHCLTGEGVTGPLPDGAEVRCDDVGRLETSSRGRP